MKFGHFRRNFGQVRSAGLEAELGEVLRFPDVAVTTLIFANPRYVNQTTKARQVGLTGLVFIETIFGTRLSGGGGDRT